MNITDGECANGPDLNPPRPGRLLVQLDETACRFEGYWSGYERRLRRWLQLRRFDHGFRECQVRTPEMKNLYGLDPLIFYSRGLPAMGSDDLVRLAVLVFCLAAHFLLLLAKDVLWKKEMVKWRKIIISW